MTDRSIFVRLGAIATGLKQGLKEASAEARKTAADIEAAGKKSDAAVAATAKRVPLLTRGLEAFRRSSADVSKWVTKNRDDIDKLATTGLIVGGLLAAGAAVAAKRFADFDQAMSHVAATGDDARRSMGALREAAVQAGADTAFSAVEAAQGVEALAKAGVSARDILAGGLTGSLSLAAAGNLSVADSAEVAATALVQFGLSGSQMSHVADLLAAGAGKAQGEVSDLALALKYVGPVAAGMNVSIEETVGALAGFASQGILADQAGTSLRGVLAALTSPSKAAQAEIERLGITLYDGQGQFLGLANMAGELQKAYAGVSDQAKDASLGILFGNQQVTAARVLFDQGAQGIQGWTDKVDDAGFAAEAARTRMDNLAGDVEKLAGSFDSVLIQSGSGLNEMLRGVVQNTESVVDAIGQIPPGALGAVTALAGTGGLGVLGVSALGKLAVGINDAKAAMVALTGSTKAAGLAAGALGAAIGVGAIAFTLWADRASEARRNAEDFATTLVVVGDTVEMTAGTLGLINTKLADTSTLFGFGPTLLDLMEQVGVSASDAQGYLLGEADAVDRVNKAMQDYVRNNPLFGSTPTTLLQKGLDDLKLGMTEAERKTLQKAKADREAGTAAEGHSSALETINSYLTRQSDAAGTATTSLQEYQDALWGAANAALKLSGTEIGFRQSVADAGKKIHKGKGLDTRTQAGRDNQGALNEILGSGKARVDGILEVEGQGKKASAAMRELRIEFVQAAKAATGSREEAVKLADELGLIPSNVNVDINTELNREGIQRWEMWKPGDKWPKIRPRLTQSTFDVTLKTVWQVSGGPKFGMADGGVLANGGRGLVQRFADGGFPSIGAQQPQIQPTRPGGIMWAEDTRAPWEAFISGDPAKRDRSVSIWEKVGQDLGVARYADGGIRDNRALRDALYAGSTARVTNVNVRTYYPQAEPVSRTVNRALQDAAALGVI